MSMDASLGVVVPTSHLNNALDAIRSLASEMPREDGDIALFWIRIPKDEERSRYFSHRSRYWQAEIVVEQGAEFSEITFSCPTNDDGMELVVDDSPILAKISQALSSHRLVGGYLCSDGERLLLTKRLKPSKARVDWDSIPYGAEGVEQLAALCTKGKHQ
ncbi:hypothetical protein [Tautonia rosea]|uniref:hypothetical protein n=1 Tax=Tautonia rosea TaxID=2728037 RepID=UPI001473EEE2|nr:hypothetical protein [Tautonia rosea]